MVDKEIWKDIDGFPNYEVSNLGRVRNKKTGHIRKLSTDVVGYKSTTLYGENKPTTVRVHTLVANAFLGKRPRNYDVNHIDGDKTNNNIDNLEYCSRSDNVLHAYKTGLNKMTTSIRIVETGEVFDSINECARSIGASRKNIAMCLNDKYQRNSCKGFHFEYVNRTELSTDSIPIKIIETGEIFKSARECERAINGSHTDILNAVRNGTPYKGLHFVRYEKKPERQPFLRDYQFDAVERMHNGCILNGGVGSGKSRSGLYYYFTQQGGSIDPNYVPMKNPKDLYIITTARKRDTMDWNGELAPFLLCPEGYEKCDGYLYDNKIIVDSWNNIQKYKDVQDAFFIFDEDRVTGKGAWVKAFLKITKSNDWIILSATSGDTWEDYIPVFIANGFYKNRTEFTREHIVYSRFTKYPKIDRYLNTGRLIRLRNRILVDMDFKRHTVPHHEDVYCDYDRMLYKTVGKDRWNPYTNEPIKNASELCYTWRKIVNSDESRQIKLLEIFEKHPRIIVFYNFNYERDILLSLYFGDDVEVAEWSGHAHNPLPKGEKWIYLVQYTAGCEGWNAITTDTIVFYSQNYSYKVLEQARGRVDRMNTPYINLYYYHLKSRSSIDLAISRALKNKKNFNEMRFVGKE